MPPTDGDAVCELGGTGGMSWIWPMSGTTVLGDGPLFEDARERAARALGDRYPDEPGEVGTTSEVLTDGGWSTEVRLLVRAATGEETSDGIEGDVGEDGEYPDCCWVAERGGVLGLGAI